MIDSRVIFLVFHCNILNAMLLTKKFVSYPCKVEKSKQELKNKDAQIKGLEKTINELDFKVKEKDFRNKNLQEKVCRVYSN